MESTLKYALDSAKEITVARMGNTNLQINKDGGESAAAFYEEIFKKVLELSRENKG